MFYKKILRVIITSSCVVGVFFLFLQRDPWLLRYVGSRVNVLMSQWYACSFHADIDACAFAQGFISFKNVSARASKGDAWHWHAEKAILSWSWLDLLQGKKSRLRCTLEDIECETCTEQTKDGVTIAIMPHIMTFTAPPEIELPFEFSSVSCKNGHIQILHHPYTLGCNITGELLLTDDALRTSLNVEKGFLRKGAEQYVQNFSGKNSWFVPLSQDIRSQSHGTFDLAWDVPTLGDEAGNFKLSGDSIGGSGSCILQNADGSLQALSYIRSTLDMAGECTFPLFKGTSGVAHWSYDHGKNSLELHALDLPIPGIQQTGQAQIVVTPRDVRAHLKSSNEHHMDIDCGFEPCFNVKKIEYNDGVNTLFSCNGNAQGFAGSVPYVTLQKILQSVGLQLQGDGVFTYQGTITSSGIQSQCAMSNASLRIPLTYSVIQNMQGLCTADFYKRTLTVSDFSAALYKGEITSTQTTLFFDTDGTLNGIHMPLLLHHCFFGWKKDFFAQISGMITVKIAPMAKKSMLQGLIIFDQAHIRGNLLSAEFQQEFFEAARNSLTEGVDSQVGHGVSMCDIRCTTRTPIEIKTPFLQGSVLCQAHCTGTTSDPVMNGTFEFVRGVLEFPYKPLFITEGIITVQPQAPDDPLLHIIARNHIKKYDVELVIEGSVRSPTLTFTSSPHLEQPQIITLLLGGSEDGSLYFLMPKVMTDALETLLFGSAHTTSRVQKYLTSLFHPLKNVSITPRLSDQAGRGGVRGVLSVEVNDRLRGIIEKNVSLPEDTTFEIEYDISDDTSFRMLRDERGDYGFEGEMRWKM